MSSTLVTIIIPIFNQARFVLETIGSAVRQTHKNTEIVVIDDGSTDEGAELLRREFGNLITLIQQRNAGPSAAINAGLAAARGDFIALLGGDDLCIEERIAIQLEIMGATAHDIIFSKPQLIDDHGRRMADNTFPVFFKDVEPRLLRTLLVEGNFLCASSALMRRRVVEKIGLFHPGLIQLQDYEYWLRAAASGLSLAEFEPRIVKYRRHATNLSAQRSSFASIAETIPIMKSILDRGLPVELRAAFPHLFEPVENDALPLTHFDKVLLLLSHPRDEVRMIGIEYATALFKDTDFSAKANEVDFDLLGFIHNSTNR